ncbi:DUF1573 domain-containing protein [Fulvivirga maritima]|uniref:DUF1573 domain-containing protein n=1 Tax=Fulvivirga maritima TaxID=2904247 RepID=UPI001F33C1C9|nr:DUF1573 domain-containing protein [Fulvivirga maritima]UII28221.1 DUF1573 domain-containing protein [Fulvivirga maritima]
MRKGIKLSLFVGMLAMIFAASCSSNKESEKKIAELENRINELEGSGAPISKPATTATPAVPEEKPEGPIPAFAFEEEEFDFGTINEGDVVEHTFKFKNTGDAPLIIQNAVGSCGCTVPTWPKEPIPVGGTGEVTAKFNSKGKSNAQNKTVTLTANTWPKQTRLRIKAQVNPSETTDGPVK